MELAPNNSATLTLTDCTRGYELWAGYAILYRSGHMKGHSCYYDSHVINLEMCSKFEIEQSPNPWSFGETNIITITLHPFANVKIPFHNFLDFCALVLLFTN